MLQADSGGPLMVGDHGLVTLVGVISTGIGCAQPKLPGLYTRVSSYSTWISSHVQAP
jgi:trypsin